MVVCTDMGEVGWILGLTLGIGIATMVSVIALAWMAGQFFRKPDYEAFASFEMGQLFVSVLLVLAIFGSSCLAAEITKAFSDNQDPFEVAHGYLMEMSNKVALGAMIKLQALMVISEWTASLSMRWGASVWGWSLPAFPTFIVMEKTVSFLLALVTPFASSLIVQQVGLEIIRGVMLPYVLPMGAVLRIFPPTRNAGGYLIAVAIAFQIVFPFTYVMHAKIVRVLMEDAETSAPNADKILKDGGYGNVLSYLSAGGSFSLNMFFSPLRGISFLLLQAIFAPALSMVLVIAFIKGFTKFLNMRL